MVGYWYPSRPILTGLPVMLGGKGTRSDMKLHILTIGSPRLHYAQTGFEEYRLRIARHHSLKVTHLANKWASDTQRILQATAGTYRVSLVIHEGTSVSSHGLADFLKAREMEGKEVSFIIGGPDGLPQAIINQSDFRWSLSPLTFPHDLAMVIVAEAVYRATTIGAGHPYHH